MNHDLEAARRYHNSTKHSVASLRAHPHYLDWEIKPLPFKVYPQLEPIPLPRELAPSTVPALEAIAICAGAPEATARVPDIRALARLLHFAAGITRKKVYAGGEEYHFRAAACTGALYHIDVYAICSDVPGLAAGVYHFGPHNFALHQLRAGDYRGVLVDATGGEPSVAHAPIILACASTYWRNAWKYQARAYRHGFWDTGTMLANLLAVAAADALRVMRDAEADRAVQPIIELLTHERADVRRQAALVLADFGAAAKQAIPALSLLQKEGTPSAVRGAAACFFGWPAGSPPRRIHVRWPSGATSEHPVPLAVPATLTLVAPGA